MKLKEERNVFEIIGELAVGFLTTLELFALTLVFALPLGLLVALCTMSSFKPLKILFRIIVWVVRGTPLMLQLLIIFTGPDCSDCPLSQIAFWRR